MVDGGSEGNVNGSHDSCEGDWLYFKCKRTLGYLNFRM